MEARSLSALFFHPEALRHAVEALGGKAFHARILREQVLAGGVLDYQRMTSLSADLRSKLSEQLPILAGTERARTVASDRTTKLLLAFPDSERAEDAVECVHIPPGSRTSRRGATLCVSTQIGCPVGCPFCASGRSGLERNLQPHEILEQYLRGRALGDLSRSVVMGIGEPLLNFDNLSRALRLVHDELGLGARRITVSSIGLPDRVRRAARSKPPFQLAISLHTPFDEERERLVPAMRGTPIAEILAAGDDWFGITGREITYECVLLGGDNDSTEHARELAQLLRKRRATVNLIPYNPIGESAFRSPTSRSVDAFRAELERSGLVATVRWSRGSETDAACGQLRLRGRAGN